MLAESSSTVSPSAAPSRERARTRPRSFRLPRHTPRQSARGRTRFSSNRTTGSSAPQPQGLKPRGAAGFHQGQLHDTPGTCFDEAEGFELLGHLRPLRVVKHQKVLQAVQTQLAEGHPHCLRAVDPWQWRGAGGQLYTTCANERRSGSGECTARTKCCQLALQSPRGGGVRRNGRALRRLQAEALPREVVEQGCTLAA
jgi:hypothetical protein